MDQKLSSSPRATIRSSGRPATSRQMPRASVSEWWTVTQIFSGSSPYPPSAHGLVDRSQAKATASSLK